jgi:hypothetical protein
MTITTGMHPAMARAAAGIIKTDDAAEAAWWLAQMEMRV